MSRSFASSRYLINLTQCHLFHRRWTPNRSPMCSIHSSVNLNRNKISEHLRDCYQLLRVDEDADDDELKKAYMTLAKEYHPDSTSVTADANKFNQLQEAYRVIRAHRIDAEARMSGALSAMDDEEDDDKYGFKHKAPQHRQFLGNEGIGFGTPSQRQRQYQQYKAERASEAVANRRISIIQSQYEDALLVQDKKATRKRTVRSGMERLVEDLIQESMAKGDFKNLPGEGKPLNTQAEAYKVVDDLTYNLNKIVIDQGFAPEWVRLNGSISKDLNAAREMLRCARIQAGSEPVTPAGNTLWKSALAEFQQKMEKVNEKVDRLNVVAPSMHQQQVRFNVKKEIEKINSWFTDQIQKGQIPKPPEHDVHGSKNPNKEEQVSGSIWKGITDFFKK